MSALRLFQSVSLANVSSSNQRYQRNRSHSLSRRTVRNYERNRTFHSAPEMNARNANFNKWIALFSALGLASSVSLLWDEAEAAGVDYDAVREAIAELLDKEDYDDGSYGPVFVRLAWHSAGTYDKTTRTGGSNGGTIRHHPEAGHGANAGLDVAREVLEPLIKRFPGLSYGDLYTLAGVVAIEKLGGPKIPWKPGRTDSGPENCTPDGRLPDAAQGQTHIREIFYRMGFNDREIVALIGAHALGRCHADRSGYDGKWTASPTIFSNDFYIQLLDRTWTVRDWDGPLQYDDENKEIIMLPADMAFIRDKEFRVWVEKYADDEELFFKDFAAAFGKLLALGVPGQ